MTIITIILFIFILGLLVFVHELGHFLAAKLSDIKVEEFAFGFPPRLWSRKRGETVYAVNAIPIGGYVKMLGDAEESQSVRSFSKKKPGVRALVSVAGVIMNLVLAWLILSIGFSIGMTPLVSSPDTIPGKKIKSEVIIAAVEENGAAKTAGITPGDVLLSASTDSGSKKDFLSASEVSGFTKSNVGKTVNLVYKHDDVEKSVLVKLSDQSQSPLGVSIVENAVIRVPWYLSPVVAFRELFRIVQINLVFLKSFFTRLFSSGQISKEVGGPVAIYIFTGMAAKAGAMVVAQFIAILSVSLALVNILPFPALDGGRLLFIALEKIFKKKVIKENIENIIHTIGFALIIIFAAIVTYKDIVTWILKK